MTTRLPSTRLFLWYDMTTAVYLHDIPIPDVPTIRISTVVLISDTTSAAPFSNDGRRDSACAVNTWDSERGRSSSALRVGLPASAIQRRRLRIFNGACGWR